MAIIDTAAPPVFVPGYPHNPVLVQPATVHRRVVGHPEEVDAREDDVVVLRATLLLMRSDHRLASSLLEQHEQIATALLKQRRSPVAPVEVEAFLICSYRDLLGGLTGCQHNKNYTYETI